jgi:hypothetical protein
LSFLALTETGEVGERVKALVGATAEQLGVSAFEDLHEGTLQRRENVEKNERCTTGLSAGRNCGEPVYWSSRTAMGQSSAADIA